MSFFYYLRKLTSFTHGWLLSLHLCSLCCSSFYLWVWLTECVCLCVSLFIEFALATVCVELKGAGEVVLVTSALFSLTRKRRGGAYRSWREFAWGRGFPEKEQGCCIRKRCPVGSLIVGAMMTMIVSWPLFVHMCVGECVWFFFCGCFLGETGVFYQEEKVCLCVCFLCVFFITSAVVSKLCSLCFSRFLLPSEKQREEFFLFCNSIVMFPNHWFLLASVSLFLCVCVFFFNAKGEKLLAFY